MSSDRELLERLYERFNARDMETLLAGMHRDVVWANGLEGGHVYGHDGVREYWTRQWAAMESRVEPLAFSSEPDGRASVAVHVIAHDHNGAVIFDRKVDHLFRIEHGLITRFDIRG